MMCGFATFWGKHRIIASETSNIIFAKQMHHIAAGDASFNFPSALEKHRKLCYNEIRKAVKCMIMIYLLFAMSIFIIRTLAGYDSRYQNGKYLSIKNTVLSKILLDSMSIYSRTKRLKKDNNKMSICGIPFYVTAAFVLLINLVFLFIADIPIEPWCIETSKFIVCAKTFNDKISAISILLLLMSIIA